MSARLRVLGAVAAVSLAAACGKHSPGSPMLPDGKEAIYSFLSQGKVAVADEALHDVWDLGPRSQPIHIAPITWTEDPYDRYWRVLFYALRPLSNLLFAYYTTGDHAYLDKLCEVLRSYTAFEAQRGTTPSAFLDEPHTAAFREMMLVNIRGKLQRTGDLPSDLEGPLRDVIEKTGAYLADDRNFQDGENHGFNEAAALLVAAANLPEMPEAAAWQDLALGRLGGLMGDAVDDDGVEIENSPFYHFYVLSFVTQDSRWMHAYGVPLPDGFDDKLSRMFAYATYAPMPNGKVPLLGSSVSLDMRKLLPNVYDESSLDGMPGLADVTPEFEYVRSGGADGTQPSERNKRFDVSGQGFLRAGFGSKGADFDGRTWMSFNVGTWRSKHCHLDALAVTYYSGGAALLPDSGLYVYGEDPFGEYFSGTRGHNTVVVDRKDQSNAPDVVASVTPGLVLSGEDWAYQSGSHQLYAGVTHARSVLLVAQDVALVVDRLQSNDAHDYVQTWHLWPDAQVSSTGLDVTATDAAGRQLHLAQGFTDGVQVGVIEGQQTPVVQGWYSSEYGQRVPSPALEYGTHAASASFATVIVSGARASGDVTVRAQVDVQWGVTATICAGDVQRVVTIAAQALPGETVAVTEDPQACAPSP
jgi:hypothetical protein